MSSRFVVKEYLSPAFTIVPIKQRETYMHDKICFPLYLSILKAFTLKTKPKTKETQQVTRLHISSFAVLGLKIDTKTWKQNYHV